MVIILAFGTCAWISSGSAASSSRRADGWERLSLSIGSVYLAVMVLRYAIRMSLYPSERWTGGSIPIVFHWVLAAFILVLGAYHWRSFPAPVRRSRAMRWMQVCRVAR